MKQKIKLISLLLLPFGVCSHISSQSKRENEKVASEFVSSKNNPPNGSNHKKVISPKAKSDNLLDKRRLSRKGKVFALVSILFACGALYHCTSSASEKEAEQERKLERTKPRGPLNGKNKKGFVPSNPEPEKKKRAKELPLHGRKSTKAPKKKMGSLKAYLNGEGENEDFLLLDVDQTVLIENEINQQLIQALVKAKIKNVALFTWMSVDKIRLEKGKSHDGEKKRWEVIQALEEEGIKVWAVITPLDPNYEKGLGAAYKHIVEDEPKARPLFTSGKVPKDKKRQMFKYFMNTCSNFKGTIFLIDDDIGLNTFELKAEKNQPNNSILYTAAEVYHADNSEEKPKLVCVQVPEDWKPYIEDKNICKNIDKRIGPRAQAYYDAVFSYQKQREPSQSNAPLIYIAPRKDTVISYLSKELEGNSNPGYEWCEMAYQDPKNNKKITFITLSQ